MEPKDIAENILIVLASITFVFVVIVAVVNALKTEDTPHARRSQKGTIAPRHHGCTACAAWDDMGRQL